MNIQTTKGSYLSKDIVKGSYLSGELTKGSYLSGEMTKGSYLSKDIVKGSYLSDEITKGSYMQTSKGMGLSTDKHSHKPAKDDYVYTNEYERAREYLYGKKKPKQTKPKEPEVKKEEKPKEEPKRDPTPEPIVSPVFNPDPDSGPVSPLPSNATESVKRTLLMFKVAKDLATLNVHGGIDTDRRYGGHPDRADSVFGSF